MVLLFITRVVDLNFLHSRAFCDSSLWGRGKVWFINMPQLDRA